MKWCINCLLVYWGLREACLCLEPGIESANELMVIIVLNPHLPILRYQNRDAGNIPDCHLFILYVASAGTRRAALSNKLSHVCYSLKHGSAWFLCFQTLTSFKMIEVTSWADSWWQSLTFGMTWFQIWCWEGFCLGKSLRLKIWERDSSDSLGTSRENCGSHHNLV